MAIRTEQMIKWAQQYKETKPTCDLDALAQKKTTSSNSRCSIIHREFRFEYICIYSAYN